MYIDLVERQKRRKEPVSADIAFLGAAPSSPYLREQILETLNISKLYVIS